MNWQDKIQEGVQGIEDIIDYCYLTVLGTWLTRQKEEHSQDSLVRILTLTGHPHLAKCIMDDSEFTLNLKYLCLKLRPIKYEYRVFGSLLGLDLPDHNYLVEHMKNISALYLTVVIMQWIQRDAGRIPSKELLEDALIRIMEEKLAEKLLLKYSGNDKMALTNHVTLFELYLNILTDYAFPGDV